MVACGLSTVRFICMSASHRCCARPGRRRRRAPVARARSRCGGFDLASLRDEPAGDATTLELDDETQLEVAEEDGRRGTASQSSARSRRPASAELGEVALRCAVLALDEHVTAFETPYPLPKSDMWSRYLGARRRRDGERGPPRHVRRPLRRRRAAAAPPPRRASFATAPPPPHGDRATRRP